jgi:hypothetical protein
MARRLFVAAGLGLLAGCSTVQLVDTWRDANVQARRYQRVMVVGIAEQPDRRRTFEDIFVSELRSRGVDAIASHTVTPGYGKLTREELVDGVRKSNAQAVVTARVTGRQEHVEVTPGVATVGPGYIPPHAAYPHNMYGFYGAAMVTPPSVYTYVETMLEACLFDVGSSDMVWSASLSTTETAGNLVGVSKDLSRLVVDQLRKDGFI